MTGKVSGGAFAPGLVVAVVDMAHRDPWVVCAKDPGVEDYLAVTGMLA